MDKITEALKLAEKLAKRYGVRMCDENGETHGEELYCVGIDDIADIIREALADHIADTGKVIAEPVQEPVAHYKDAPHTIYLQTGCDDPEDCECIFNEWGDTTWCVDQIHDTDIPYIRADYAAPVSEKREWVDLTLIELAKAFVGKGSADAGIRAVIAAFKEKNA